MKDLTKEFFRRCAKTNLWQSDQEESRRYSNYPKYLGFNRLRWHIINFSSKWEWLPRQKFHIEKDKEE